MRFLLSLSIVFFLLGCTNNSTQVWVADLDTNIRPQSLEKVKPVKYKKDKDFFKRTEILKLKEIQNFSEQLQQQNSKFWQKFITQTPDAKNWILEESLSPEIKESVFFARIEKYFFFFLSKIIFLTISTNGGSIFFF